MVKKEETELFDVPEPEPKPEIEAVPEAEAVAEPVKREKGKKAKRVLSPEEKARRLACLAKGRATSLANRRAKAALKQKEKEEASAAKDQELQEYLDQKTKKLDVIGENKRLRMELEKMKNERKTRPVKPMDTIKETVEPPVKAEPVKAEPVKAEPVKILKPPSPPPPAPAPVDKRHPIFHGTKLNLKALRNL